METVDVKGLVILTGIVVMYALVLSGCLERRLKKIDRIIEESKYVS
jgi:hypothetical protein